MVDNLLHWICDLPMMMLEFGSWLTQPLPYINLSPLACFGIAGISAIIIAELVRLFVGG